MLGSKEKEAEATFAKYKDILYRVAFSNMKSKADAEDVVQEAFCKYLKLKPSFDSENHEKAWFIRVVINICYDIQKSAWFSRTVALEEVPECEMRHFQLPFVEEDGTLWHVMELPAAYRNPLYLFYYEDYSIKEIARIMELGEGAVKTRLRRGRELIKERIVYGTGRKGTGLTEKALKEGGRDADS